MSDQRLLTADIIAKEALAILTNNLGVLDTFHRAHEDEFKKEVNGYTVGNEISIRRPHDPRPRLGNTMQLQEVIEGKTTLKVDKVVGHDFSFTSEERTMNIKDLGERVIKPAMINIVEEIARDCLEQMYLGFYNWVGTPLEAGGAGINSYADFYKGVQRLHEMAVPTDQRYCVLSPEDEGALLSTQTGMFIQGAANDAYRDGKLGRIGGVTTLMSQVVPTFTSGTPDNTTPLVDGDETVNVKAYKDVKDTWTQTLVTDGWDPTSATLKAGTVFTIADCYMVNPRTKANTGILQQFVVVSDVSTAASAASDTEITISPPIITSGPHQTVVLTSAINDNAIVLLTTPEKTYKQNMMYHKNAFGLAVVPMHMPEAVGDKGSRQTHKGFSVRVIPGFDVVNNVEKWRLDVLYGRKLLDPRVGLRISGTT